MSETDQAQALHSHGMLAFARGDHGEAARLIERALDLRPGFPEALNNLSIVREAQGQLEIALELLDRSLLQHPDFVQALNNRGNLLRRLGRREDAHVAYERALAVESNAAIHNNLATLLVEMGDRTGAIYHLERAIATQRDYVEAHNNLGAVLLNLGNVHAALARLELALVWKPDHVEAMLNMARALGLASRRDEAVDYLRKALALRPQSAAIHHELGVAYLVSHNEEEAIGELRVAVALDPALANAYSDLGKAFKNLGLVREGLAAYREAMRLDPGNPAPHSNLIFALDLLEGCSVREQQAERARWYAQHGRRFAESIAPHGNLADPERRLRIGYVSADFRRHAANYAFGPIIHLHERSEFEVICYSGVTIEDDATARLRQSAGGWRSTLGVSDEDLAGQIRSDRIDILVDLSAHMAGNRLLVFARKPAPVQVTAWGYPNGTGLKTIDYLLADSVVIPDEERSLFAEEVIDLPCFICYEPPEYLPDVLPLPALAARPFTFGCISRIEKISDAALRLWGRILAALPDARLLIKGQALDDEKNRRRFLGRLHDAGIGAERVRLIGSSSHGELLRTFQDVDLGLDPFPHGGAIGTAEALWMGVPVVTLQGATFMSRISASILTALQMQEWIARSDEEYVRIAVEASQDTGRLVSARAQFRARLAGSIFGDMQRYTREVEAAYRSMWRRWCAGVGASPPAASTMERN